MSARSDHYTTVTRPSLIAHCVPALTFKSLRTAVTQSQQRQLGTLAAGQHLPRHPHCPHLQAFSKHQDQCRTFLCKQVFYMVSSSLNRWEKWFPLPALSIILVSSKTSLLHISRKIKLASNLPFKEFIKSANREMRL